ncbi:MAG: hypothetical protein Alpg2KO_08800 [Alphaproteobacteria bacterium]
MNRIEADQTSPAEHSGWLMRRWRRQGLSQPLAVPDGASRATGRSLWLTVLAGMALALIWAARLPSMPEPLYWMLTSFGCALSLFALSLVPELLFRRKHGLALLSEKGITLCDNRVTVPFAAIRDVEVLKLETLDLDLLCFSFEGASTYRRLLLPFGRVSLLADWLAEKFLTVLHLPFQQRMLRWVSQNEEPGSRDAQETAELMHGLQALIDLLDREAQRRETHPDQLTLTIDLGNNPAISARGLAHIVKHHAGLPGHQLDVTA